MMSNSATIMKNLIFPLLYFAVTLAVAASEKTRCRIVFVSVGSSTTDLRYATGNGLHEVVATTTAISGSVSYSGAPRITFHAADTKQEVTSCDLPAGASTVLVVLRRAESDGDKAKAEKWCATAHDLSPQSVRPGHFLWINLSGGSVVASLGDEVQKIADGGSASFRVDPGYGMISARLAESLADDAKAGKRLFATSWPEKPKQVNVVVVTKGESRAYPVTVSRHLYAPE